LHGTGIPWSRGVVIFPWGLWLGFRFGFGRGESGKLAFVLLRWERRIKGTRMTHRPGEEDVFIELVHFAEQERQRPGVQSEDDWVVQDWIWDGQGNRVYIKIRLYCTKESGNCVILIV